MKDLRNNINEKRALLIDKSIITKGTKYAFDIYGHDSKHENIVLIFEANNTLTENMYKNIITTRYLYVHEKDKSTYKDFHTLNSQEVKKSIDLTNILKDIDNVAFNILEDPESQENLESAKKVVKDTVSLFLQDDKLLSSAISIFSHNYHTHTHCVHVKVYAICLGKQMGFDKDTLEDLGITALLHDIGKSQIPKQLLNKKETLSKEEFLRIKEHSNLGFELVKKLGIKNPNILLGIKQHHEKEDGSGYPDGVSKDKISQFAKIISICDIFDALSSRRTYKEPLTAFEALLEMKKEMSSQIDMKILNQFILMLNSSTK